MNLTQPNPNRKVLFTRSRQGPNLWGLLYGSLWLNTTLLATLVFFPRAQASHLKTMAAWAGGLGVPAGLAWLLRIAIHDMLAGLNLKERFFLVLLMAIIFVIPGFLPGFNLLGDGFLWVAPFLIMAAVKAPLARRLLAWNLLGAWCAAGSIHDLAGLGWLLAFGVSWLLALGAHHFAFTGDPYGLSGWWPLRKVLGNALLASLPATLAGVLAWWIWPEHGLAFLRVSARPAGGVRMDLVSHPLPPAKMAQLYWDLMTCILLLAGLLALMLLVRRYFLKRRRAKIEAGLPPEQQASMEYRPEPAALPSPTLDGPRGEIVKLWGRWAAARERAGHGRKSGETAAQYAQRLAGEDPLSAPPAAMTELLERAHYSREELTTADVEAMRAYVRELM